MTFRSDDEANITSNMFSYKTPYHSLNFTIFIHQTKMLYLHYIYVIECVIIYTPISIFLNAISWRIICCVLSVGWWIKTKRHVAKKIKQNWHNIITFSFIALKTVILEFRPEDIAYYTPRLDADDGHNEESNASPPVMSLINPRLSLINQLLFRVVFIFSSLYSMVVVSLSDSCTKDDLLFLLPPTRVQCKTQEPKNTCKIFILFFFSV